MTEIIIAQGAPVLVAVEIAKSHLLAGSDAFDLWPCFSAVGTRFTDLRV